MGRIPHQPKAAAVRATDVLHHMLRTMPRLLLCFFAVGDLMSLRLVDSAGAAVVSTFCEIKTRPYILTNDTMKQSCWERYEDPSYKARRCLSNLGTDESKKKTAEELVEIVENCQGDACSHLDGFKLLSSTKGSLVTSHFIQAEWSGPG